MLFFNRKLLILFAVSLFLTVSTKADYIRGKITDDNGKALGFTNVYVKNTSYGVCANNLGNYFLELKPGNYTIVFSFIGYNTVEEWVVIKEGQPVIINIVMTEVVQMLDEIVVGAEKNDRAKIIIQEVRKKRKYYLDKIENYQCKTYLKTSLEKEYLKAKKDSFVSDTNFTIVEDLSEILAREHMNLIEAVSTVYFRAPSQYREEVLAYNDYTEKRPYFGPNVSYSMSFGREDILPKVIIDQNPNILYKDISSSDLNFYSNMIVFPSLSQDQILSPIAASSAFSYQYELMGSFYEDDKLIYKIAVTPIFKNEALFSGVIFIEDSSWVLKSVDLTVNQAAVHCCVDVRIIQNYEEVDSEIYLPVRRELIYTIRDGSLMYYGNTRVQHSDYQINIPLDNKIFGGEIKKYVPEAYDRDSAYWHENRTLRLKDEELDFITRSDSIAAYFEGEEYLRKIDSAFNRLHWWIWLTGVGHRNRVKGTEWYIQGLPAQMKFFGFGGYRHSLPFYFNKRFSNGMLLETDNFIDYGFGNNDVKGKIGMGLTYRPMKFMRTFVRVGDVYEMINTYSSFEQVFSMSNYVRARTLSISQRMEVVNGLYGELTFNFSDQEAVTDLQLSEWSQKLFGGINNPIDFERYKKAELRLELRYLIKQKYIIRNNSKIVLGTDYPQFSLTYRKGIPTLLGSEVNFDFIELGARGDHSFPRFGYSRWDVMAASFLNKKNLREMEYRYFRGSDRYIFSDPLRSFQLMGPTFLTNKSYFRANYIHHFEGAMLKKIPLIGWLRLQPVVGAGTILIPGEEFSHLEIFGGIERVIRIKRQLFRLGVYGVTADSNIDKADFTLKFGLDFFNPYSGRWNY